MVTLPRITPPTMGSHLRDYQNRLHEWDVCRRTELFREIVGMTQQQL